MPLNILLTALYFDGPTGTSVYVSEIARRMVQRGHAVSVYSPTAGRAGELLERAGIKVHRRTSSLVDAPNIVHASGNVMASAAQSAFPEAPLIFHSHGVIPPFERLPTSGAALGGIVAVSEEVLEARLSEGAPSDRLFLLRNPVDVRRFQASPLPDRPRRALIISNRMDAARLRALLDACHALDIEVDAIGTCVSRPVMDPRPYIERAHIVFTLGMGAIQAMAAGRAVFVYDYLGSDGWINPETVFDIRRCNFSGRRWANDFGVGELSARIRDGYSPALGTFGRNYVQEEHDLGRHVSELLRIYSSAQEAPRAGTPPAGGAELSALLDTLSEIHASTPPSRPKQLLSWILVRAWRRVCQRLVGYGYSYKRALRPRR